MQTIVTTENQASPSNPDANRLCITALASLPENTLIDQTKLADILGVTTRTVRRMVCRFELPEPIKLAGHSVWTVGVLVDYLNASLQKGAEKSRKNLIAISKNN